MLPGGIADCVGFPGASWGAQEVRDGERSGLLTGPSRLKFASTHGLVAIPLWEPASAATERPDRSGRS
jgi:hypothetical protein